MALRTSPAAVAPDGWDRIHAASLATATATGKENSAKIFGCDPWRYDYYEIYPILHGDV